MIWKLSVQVVFRDHFQAGSDGFSWHSANFPHSVRCCHINTVLATPQPQSVSADKAVCDLETERSQTQPPPPPPAPNLHITLKAEDLDSNILSSPPILSKLLPHTVVWFPPACLKNLVSLSSQVSLHTCNQFHLFLLPEAACIVTYQLLSLQWALSKIPERTYNIVWEKVMCHRFSPVEGEYVFHSFLYIS